MLGIVPPMFRTYSIVSGLINRFSNHVRCHLLLLLGRNIETKPGPVSIGQEELLNNVYYVVQLQTLQTGQDDNLWEVRELAIKQRASEESVIVLTTRVTSLKKTALNDENGRCYEQHGVCARNSFSCLRDKGTQSAL